MCGQASDQVSSVGQVDAGEPQDNSRQRHACHSGQIMHESLRFTGANPDTHPNSRADPVTLTDHARAAHPFRTGAPVPGSRAGRCAGDA
jgi:hypothetical protein